MNFATLPAEIIQNTFYFLPLSRLWCILSVNKRIQYITLDVISKRLRLAFQHGRWKLMLEVFVEQPPSKDIGKSTSIRLLGNFSHIDSNSFHAAFNLCSLPKENFPSTEKAMLPSNIISSLLLSPINDSSNLESVSWYGHEICKITANVNLVHESFIRPSLLSDIIRLEDELSLFINHIDLQCKVPNGPLYRQNFVNADGDMLQKMLILVGIEEQSIDKINVDLEGSSIWFVQAIFRSKIFFSIDE